MAPACDAAPDDPWLAHATAWAFVERSLLAGLGTIAGRCVVDVGCGTDAWRERLGATGRRVLIEPLGPLLTGLAGITAGAG